MGSFAYDPVEIEQELRNSRKIVEKSMELSRKHVLTENYQDNKLLELVERLRNEEYLKNSFEKALNEVLGLLKEEQKKNSFNERRIAELEGRLEKEEKSKLDKISKKLKEIEKKTQKEGLEQQKILKNKSLERLLCENSSYKQRDESERIDELQRRLKDLEKLINKRNTGVQSSKIIKSGSLVRTKQLKIPKKTIK